MASRGSTSTVYGSELYVMILQSLCVKALKDWGKAEPTVNWSIITLEASSRTYYKVGTELWNLNRIHIRLGGAPAK